MRPILDYLEIEQLYSQSFGKGVKSVAVCSANSGEGCSTVACALAQRSQRSGRSTLLVDMNFFRPTLHHWFEVPRSDWRMTPESALQATYQDATGLSILTAPTSTIMDLRCGDALQAMIHQWEGHYEAVIIDTSPLNAMNKRNLPAELVASRVQATLLTLRSTITTEADVLAASAKLENHQAHLWGVVMNDADCPSLADELIRECRRLSPFAAKLSQWLINRIKQNHFLNMPI